jgi:hypothetical protein
VLKITVIGSTPSIQVPLMLRSDIRFEPMGLASLSRRESPGGFFVSTLIYHWRGWSSSGLAYNSDRWSGIFRFTRRQYYDARATFTLCRAPRGGVGVWKGLNWFGSLLGWWFFRDWSDY